MTIPNAEGLSLRLASQALAEAEAELQELGIRVEISVARTAGQSADRSEIEIYFWRGRAVADVLEFDLHSWDKSTQEEAQRWLRESVADVISRVRSKAS